MQFNVMGFPIRWYMGDGSIVCLVAESDEDDMNKVPDRVYKVRRCIVSLNRRQFVQQGQAASEVAK